jgi:YD repeat-containing protein
MRRARHLLVLGLSALLARVPVAAADIIYLYDAKSQLVGMIAPDGSAVSWTWDPNGNLVAVTRTDASSLPGPVGITLVHPSGGNVGDPVEIFGKGLANPTAVTFYNGVAAIPLSSENHSIRTTVPVGAATGRINLTTPLGAATSPANFTILPTMTISPAQVAVLPARTRQFTASAPAVWSVGGQQGGNAQVGTISTGGLYTAPSVGPFPKLVSVAAQSALDPTNRAEAVVEIIATPLVQAKRVSAAVRQTPVQTGPLRAAAVAAERQPVITAVSPAAVARGSSNVTLTLTGQGLANPTALAFLLNGANDGLITQSNLTALPDGSQATVTISIPSTATIAGRVLQITAGGSPSTPAGTGTNVLQVTGP